MCHPVYFVQWVRCSVGFVCCEGILVAMVEFVGDWVVSPFPVCVWICGPVTEWVSEFVVIRVVF